MMPLQALFPTAGYNSKSVYGTDTKQTKLPIFNARGVNWWRIVAHRYALNNFGTPMTPLLCGTEEYSGLLRS